MNIKFILNPEDEYFDLWKYFVLKEPKGNIFQTPYMYNVIKNTKNYEPLAILLMDETENIHGVLMAIKQKFGGRLFNHFASRSLIIGGPVINENSEIIIGPLMKYYNSVIRNSITYTEIRNVVEVRNITSQLAGEGYLFEDHLNILINLEKSETELWNDINSKRKNEIRRAVREGLVFSEGKSEQDLLRSYYILIEVYKKARLPLPDYSFFRSAWELSNDEMGLKLFVVKFEDNIIGTMITLCFNRTLYDYFAGSYQKYLSKYPNDLLPWEVILWAKRNGYNKYDFGGAGKPDIPYGVREYKRKFGGELINFGRLKKIHNPSRMKAAELGFKLWQIVKR